MFRKVFDKNRGGDTVVRPVVPAMELVVVCELKNFVLQRLRDTEALSAPFSCKVHQGRRSNLELFSGP